MTITPRVRIAKVGKSIFSSDPRDFVMDERYNMFKYHSTNTTSVILNGGDTEKSATVSHNLGYIPAYIVYYKRSDENVERILPDIPYGVGFDFYPWAYATATGITVGYTSAEPYNQIINYSNDNFMDWGSGSYRGYWAVGNVTGDSTSGAIRIQSVNLSKNQSITSATLNARVTTRGSGRDDTKMKIYGINEDNTGDFSSNPMGRTKTEAVTSQNQASSTPPYYCGINVKSQVETIIARAGWSKGNAMGFIINDNSTPNDTYIGGTDNNSYLSILIPGTLTISFRVIIFKDKIA